MKLSPGLGISIATLVPARVFAAFVTRTGRHRFVILASVAVLAASAANCANSGGPSAMLTAPSVVAASVSNGVAAPAAITAADKGGGRGGGGNTGGSGSLTLVMVTDNNKNGLPNWGDTVTFNISTTATTEPNVSLTCSQNGVVVYGAVAGFYPSYPAPWTQIMPLSSNAWQGGAASCIAKLYYFSGTSTINLTSISVTAGG